MSIHPRGRDRRVFWKVLDKKTPGLIRRGNFFEFFNVKKFFSRETWLATLLIHVPWKGGWNQWAQKHLDRYLIKVAERLWVVIINYTNISKK